MYAGGISYFSSGSVRSGLRGGVCPEATPSATAEIRHVKKPASKRFATTEIPITLLALFLIQDSNLVEIYLRNNGNKLKRRGQQRGNAALGSPGKLSLPEPSG